MLAAAGGFAAGRPNWIIRLLAGVIAVVLAFSAEGVFGAVRACFRRYANFTARAGRPEFWYFVLFVLLGGLGTFLVDVAVLGYDPAEPGPYPVSTLFDLAVCIPGISVTTRRLHDIGRNGWWQLIEFSGVGIVVVFAWACMKGVEEWNEFGPPPSTPSSSGSATDIKHPETL
jgi:uncharacterized membrane protein YhaH (DUF805 family)